MLPHRLLPWLVLLCASAAAAQAPPQYAIRHYELRLEPDFPDREVHTRVTVRISNPGLLDRFSFALAPEYSAALQSAGTVERTDGKIIVKLAKPAADVQLTFEIHGAPAKSRDVDRPVLDANSLFLLWSDRWYPVDFDHWAPVTTTVVLPEGFQAIAPGRLVKTQTVAGKTEFTFEERNPAVSFSVFADRRWIRTERDLYRMRIQTLLHPESQKWAEQIFETSSIVLKFFNELHGDYPFEQFSFITIDGLDARRAFAGFVGYSPQYLDREMTRTGYDAHETSLLWWGYATRGAGPGSWQWTEGFGDYAEAMYAEASGKPLAAIFGRFRDDYLATPADQDPDFTELRGNTPQKFVHGKYPWLMHVLRLGIGDDAFRDGVRLLLQRYARATFTMDQFIAVFQETSGQSLEWWRKQWLERKGAPEVEFKCAPPVPAEPGSSRVSCTLKQRTPPRRIPAEIKFRSGKDFEIHRVIFDADTPTVTLRVSGRPEEIVFDPNKRLPVRVIESAPVAPAQ